MKLRQMQRGILRLARVRLAGGRAIRAFVVGTLLAWSPCAFALNPSLPVTEYGHTAWKRGDAFSSGIFTAIAQTPDGYLWLGSSTGFLRFDGARFVHWEPPAGQQLPATAIISLLVTRDGALWIGTSNGLAKWSAGRLRTYPEVAGFVRLIEDRDGTDRKSVV